MVEKELETQPADPRPALAVGHVELHVRSVAQTSEFLVRLGARPIAERENLAVLEVRGGTHLVVMPRHPGWVIALAPTSSVNGDPIHSWFHITEPSGTRLTIMSSHAGQRRV
jgi:hypothetical protein